jgi:hypothetical protein
LAHSEFTNVRDLAKLAVLHIEVETVSAWI